MDGRKDKKTEELKKELTEDRRTYKKTTGKQQREPQRDKSQHPPSARDFQEALVKEIEKERMMRLGTEQRLQDMQLESDSCRMRLHALQEEFRKMEEMVSNMLQYKAKIDQLKQENASMKSSYENNLQKYCSHISTLERDNMMLRNQVKKMEAQIHGKGDERDKSKLLLERLKMVEAENSSLVLENEQQRQQYEKCLDEIANQVVQALLAQKTLREECLKLQGRVQDLELQNKHLNIMFQQRLKFNSDSVLQIQNTSCVTTNHVCQTSISTSSAMDSLALSQREMTLDLLGTASSLQSMCSEIMGDDSPGKPQLSSPPPWLRDKLLASPGTERDSSSSSGTSSSSTTSPPTPEDRENIVQTKIETEFPATNSSPRVKHISVYERRARSLERGLSSPLSWARRSGRGGHQSRRSSDSLDKNYSSSQRLKQSTSADAISRFEISNKMSASQIKLLTEALQRKSSPQDRLVAQSFLQSLPKDDSPAVLIAGPDFSHKSFETFNRNFEKLLAKNSCEETSSSESKSVTHSSESAPQTAVISPQPPPSLSATPSQTLTSQKMLTQNRTSHSPALRNPFAPLKSPRSQCSVPGQYYYYDYSDEDSDSRPVSRDFSTASSMSLNELLDSSAEGEVAIDDDFFSDWSSVYITPKKRIDCLSGITVSHNSTESKHSKTGFSSSTQPHSTLLSPSASEVPVSHSLSSIKNIKPKQGKITKATDAIKDVKTDTCEAKSCETNPVVTSTKGKDSNKIPIIPNTESKESRTEKSESRACDKLSCPSVEVHSEDMPDNFLPSSTPSPNLSQKSQDLGYASKGSYSHSSPSPSPSVTHRGTPLWLQSTKDPHSISRNELKTSVISKDASDSGSGKFTSSPQAPKLTRPGQLILAPQDKNFNFQGFSSGSSTGSEDKSPLKIFESRQTSDMKSSVIEVKKEGAYPHTVKHTEDKNSLTASPSSLAKSSSKISPPVAKKPATTVKPDNSDKDTPNKFPGPGSTNITVGFLVNSQIFPGQTSHTPVEDFLRKTLTDTKEKNQSGQPQDPGSHFQTKCQSSDSSFENLRVEHSGSKDDGYSTMSSDIHPEVLEKFSDTLTRKVTVSDYEHHGGIVKSSATDISAHQMEGRGSSDPSIHCRDRSFDLTSDPDSALETSVHSTAEMVTSSSSQVSTSSSDYPLSPCSTKVSKIARLFDGENTKLSFMHRTGASNSCRHKDNSVSSSSKASSNSSSPGSPNAFVPSCYQPPESPRRLAMEFQKFNMVKSPGSPVVFRKLSPGSPKSLSNSFTAFLQNSEKQQPSSSQVVNEIPVESSNKPFDSNPPSLIQQLDCKASSETGVKRLPKGFYSSFPQGSKNVHKVFSQTKGQNRLTSTEAVSRGSENESANSKTESNAETVANKRDSNIISTATTDKNLQPIISASTRDKKLGARTLPAKDSTTKCYKFQPKSYAKSTSNTVLPAADEDTQSNSVTARVNDSILCQDSNSSLIGSAYTISDKNSQCSVTDMSMPSDTVIVHGSNVSVESVVLTADKIDGSTLGHKYFTSQRSSTAVSGAKGIRESSTLSTESVHSHNLSSHPRHDHSVEVAVDSTSSTHHSQKQSSRIIMTNHGFQQVSSDSENNEDDDSSSLPSITFDDNFLEDIPEENDSCDNYIVNNIRDLHSNVTNNSTIKTNSASAQLKQQPSHLATSEQMNTIYHEQHDSTNTVSLKSSNSAVSTQLSTENRQHNQQDHTGNNEFLNQHLNAPQRTNQNTILSTIFRAQCLCRSKSEQNLSSKPRSTSSYDDFFGMAWNSGKVLERSTSVSEIDLLPQRSRLLDLIQNQCQKRQAPDKENCSRHQPPTSHNTRTPLFFLPPPPPSHLSPNQHHYHQYHLQPNRYRQQNSNSPWVQTLHLDLSDVTELDEEGSELATTRDSLDSSNLDIVNDDSPRSDVNEQKLFNSQFYSLCKVDSNRSLLSSGNESKDGLSLTNLSEILSSKTEDSNGELNIQEASSRGENFDEENEIAIKEFDEISQQIASLSKTVDQLNQSLSSLNSGEFEPSSSEKAESSAPEKCVTKSDVIDGYHWADDEFFLTSCNGEIIFGGRDMICDDALDQILTNNSSSDLNSTEDATSEFYQLPLHDVHRNSTGQDEIFAGSFFDTVKEKSPVKKRKQKVLVRSGSDGNLKEKPVKEKRFSMPIYCKSLQDRAVKREGGSDVKEGISSTLLMEKQGDDQTDKLTGSNNDSDDSLASDIGLDHMMCQRLFGRKGRQSSSKDNKTFIDLGQLFMKYGDPEQDAATALGFVNNFRVSQLIDRTQRSEGSICSEVENKTCPVDVSNSNESDQACDEDSTSPLSTEHQGKISKEMRDVGVDAMSQSQHSMNTSFETFDQSLLDLHLTEDKFKSSDEPSEHCGGLGLSSNQKFRNSGSFEKIESTDAHRNLYQPSYASATEIVAHGGYKFPETRSRCLKEQTEQRGVHSMASLTSYSDFVAELRQTSAVSIDAPPELPPRRPIITNGSLHRNLDRDIAPLPPPPPCLNNESCQPSYSHIGHPCSHEHKSHQHVPYVNQFIPVLALQNSNSFISRPLSDPFTSFQTVCNPGIAPPPLPPRQHQINHIQDGRSQVVIRPHRDHQDKNRSDGRPHSFNHYLINKSKAALPSGPAGSPLATFPRHRNRSETADFSTKSNSLEKSKNEASVTRIPRRKLKTRRERHQTKSSTDRPSIDSMGKSTNTGGNLSRKQWRDIDITNGTPMSDSSCEDNISS